MVRNEVYLIKIIKDYIMLIVKLLQEQWTVYAVQLRAHTTHTVSIELACPLDPERTEFYVIGKGSSNNCTDI